MKVRFGAARGVVGAEGRGRATDHVLQQQKRGQKNVWGREQGVELSRLVLGFVRQRKRLPDVGDRGFWQLCHDLFKGAFTHKQVQAKVRYLHVRFRHLASGSANTTLRVAERQILQIWTHILQLISDPSSSPSQCPSSSPSTQFASPPSTQAAVNEMGGHAARVNPGINGHSRVNPGAKKASGAAPAARQEAQEEASTCATECADDYQEFNSHGNFQNKAARGQSAFSASDDDESTHNNALLHHLTVADLAAAVKTLAEIVARGPKV